MQQSDRPTTFVTGEDFHVSHTMRKYANIGSYVMPYNASDEETKGSKYRGLSYVNAATSDRYAPPKNSTTRGTNMCTCTQDACSRFSSSGLCRYLHIRELGAASQQCVQLCPTSTKWLMVHTNSSFQLFPTNF